MYHPNTHDVCLMIDRAPEAYREHAQREEQQQQSLFRQRGATFGPAYWGHGAAQSAAFYMCDELRDMCCEDVDWPLVAEYLDETLPLD